MLATDQLLKRVVNTWLLVAHTRARTVQTQSAQGGIKMILLGVNINWINSEKNTFL